MAVHRRTNKSMRDKTVIKRPLTPLIVTIDDLQALCDFLRDRLRPEGSIELLFLSGHKESSMVLGDMDSPEDLQLLSRREMQYVRVQCDDIRIDIFRRKAFCYAPREDQEAIFNSWIRHRRRYFWQAVIVDNTVDVAVVLGLAVACLYWFWSPDFFHLPTIPLIITNIFMGIGAWITAAVVSMLLCWSIIRMKPTVVPVRLTDWNKRRQDLWQHYRTISIALLSASIAVATFIIGRVSNK